MMGEAKAWCRRSLAEKSVFQRQRFMLPHNKALKLTAPSVHAFCFYTGVEDPGPWAQKRAPRPAA